VSSNETQGGSELKMKELLDADAEHSANVDTQEFSSSSGVVGFTE